MGFHQERMPLRTPGPAIASWPQEIARNRRRDLYLQRMDSCEGCGQRVNGTGMHIVRPTATGYLCADCDALGRVE